MGGKKSFLGVDIGSVSIKIVELEDKGGVPKLLTYGYSEEPIRIIKEENLIQEEKIANILKEIIKNAHMGSREAVAALPSFTVFSSIINIPEMSKKDLETAIYWEAEKFVPMPIKDVILDWKILDSKDKKIALSKKGFSGQSNIPLEDASIKKEIKNKNLRVLLTAAPKKLVERYIRIFKLANLELLSLETESFALSRSLVGIDPSVIMIIDLGAWTSDIIIVDEGIPILSRSIDIGGEKITEVVVSTLNIDRERAEQFKIDLGSISQERIPQAIKNVLESIVNEIRYSHNLYATQSKKKIEKVILSGGSAFLANLPQYLSQALNMNVYIGNPWARVIYPTDLKTVLEELGPRFSVALGLAMREID